MGTISHSSVQLRWTFANSEFNEQLRKAIELEQQTLEGLEEGVEQISQQQQQPINQTSSNLLITRPTNVELNLQPVKPNRESLVSGYYLHYKRYLARKNVISSLFLILINL